VAKLVDAQVC